MRLTTGKTHCTYFSKHYVHARFSLLEKKCIGVIVVMTIYFSDNKCTSRTSCTCLIIS